MIGDGVVRTVNRWGIARWLGTSTSPALLPALFATRAAAQHACEGAVLADQLAVPVRVRVSYEAPRRSQVEGK